MLVQHSAGEWSSLHGEAGCCLSLSHLRSWQGQVPESSGWAGGWVATEKSLEGKASLGEPPAKKGDTASLLTLFLPFLRSFLMLIIFQIRGLWKLCIYSLAHLLHTICPRRQLKLINYFYHSGDSSQAQKCTDLDDLVLCARACGTHQSR